MASHVCDTWHAMCVTHGMPCVNMHDTLRAINRRAQIQFVGGGGGGGGGVASFSPWEQQGEGGGREKRKGGKEKRKEGKERRNGGK